MIEHRPFADLGRFRNDWLSARYHFSFADYYDPTRMGLGPLRVWNDDRIDPGTGFPMHGHRDMEIISYIRRGAITHEDHLGNRGRTEAGDVQVMTAGTGILHSEYNLEGEHTEMFQIWIEPASARLSPGWQSRQFPKESRGGLVPLASGRPEHAGDALPIHQDAAILGATLAEGEEVSHALPNGCKAYLVAARGRLDANGVELGPRDGAVITDETAVTLRALEESEIVLADLP